eukprot:3664274-Prymnesium_polylepis.1
MGFVALLLRHHLQGVTAVPERVRQSTCNAKVLGSIPEALQNDFSHWSGEMVRLVLMGEPSILRTGSINELPNFRSRFHSTSSWSQ